MIKKNYKYLAKIYDLLGGMYTGGQITIAKTVFLANLKKRKNILFLGAGRGGDAYVAKELGHNVHLLENDLYMINEAYKTFRKQFQKNLIINTDIFRYKPQEKYDIIVSNFFLNVFSKEDVLKILNITKNWLEPEGTFFVSDFSPIIYSDYLKYLQTIYFEIPLWVFVKLTGNANHKLTDYGQLLEDQGWLIKEKIPTKIFKFGPPWLTTWAATPSMSQRIKID